MPAHIDHVCREVVLVDVMIVANVAANLVAGTEPVCHLQKRRLLEELGRQQRTLNIARRTQVEVEARLLLNQAAVERD